MEDQSRGNSPWWMGLQLWFIWRTKAYIHKKRSPCRLACRSNRIAITIVDKNRAQRKQRVEEPWQASAHDSLPRSRNVGGSPFTKHMQPLLQLKSAGQSVFFMENSHFSTASKTRKFTIHLGQRCIKM